MLQLTNEFLLTSYWLGFALVTRMTNDASSSSGVPSLGLSGECEKKKKE